ncbi:MAG: hypothetical protein JO115_07310 [Pseudonocardiales bacterium]|nr:hypothetical protein [Pseudonocardiales bacterium]
MIRGTGPTHAEEWKDPEPPADDDPQLHTHRLPAADRHQQRRTQEDLRTSEDHGE